MAIPQDRKRRRTHEDLQDGRRAKAQKTGPSLSDSRSARTLLRDQIAPDNSTAERVSPPTLDHHSSWRYPPELWDRLSTIPLIRLALEELNRRDRARPAFCPPSQTSPAGDLARFARHGGPDLRDIRGYTAPVARNQENAGAMSSSPQDLSPATKSTDPTTVTKSGTTKSRMSSAYNYGFEQYLTDYGIRPTWESEKPDLSTIYTVLAKPRPSLSPSHFSDTAFKAFYKTNAQANDEDDILANVIPILTGPWEANYPSTRNMAFEYLEPLTDGTIAVPKPDIALGALPKDLDPNIRNELQRLIIPSTAMNRLIAPNFFIEAKGSDGSAAVMLRQARYDGAVGARGIHSLQNYRQKETIYDGSAYTYSSTYHNGQLQLYAHHPTAPATPGGQRDYHVTQLRAYALTNDRETFIQGATAFRNMRDLAKQHRGAFIQAANSTYQARIATAQGVSTVTAESRSEHDSS